MPIWGEIGLLGCAIVYSLGVDLNISYIWGNLGRFLGRKWEDFVGWVVGLWDCLYGNRCREVESIAETTGEVRQDLS